ncbi:MAG: M48 family metalloprotease [Candidatus Lokiarchaeota archaeon]|nr:M48 family metalloprotease [Candidatus Lokiarchaeota archaeon]
MTILAETNSEKWRSIAIFLILDLAQIIFVSLLVMDETTPFIVIFDLNQFNPVNFISIFLGISFLQFILIYGTAAGMLKNPKMTQIYPRTEKPITRWTCRYTADQLVTWTRKIADKTELAIKRIMVLQSPLPNAFTFSLPGFGSTVVIHSNITDLLDEDEVQSVIAHELGHLKNRDTIISVFSRMPGFYVFVIYLYIYLRILLGLLNSIVIDLDIITAGLRLLMLGSFLLLTFLLITISKLFVQKSSRKAELLADYASSQIVGPQTTINSLIRLGQRVEAITALVDEIKWLGSMDPEKITPMTDEELAHIISSFPLDGIDEDNARNRAPDLFLTTRLRRMREVYGLAMTDGEIENAVDPAVRKLLEKRKTMTLETESKDEPTIDWRDADIDEDTRLSDEEISKLIKMLHQNPQKMLFDNEVGANILMLDHPDFRRRILFVAEACDVT